MSESTRDAQRLIEELRAVRDRMNGEDFTIAQADAVEDAVDRIAALEYNTSVLRGAVADALDLVERLHGQDETLNVTEYYARRDRLRITLKDAQDKRESTDA